MRILVGTLYSNENEFEDCVASINSQSYTNYEHVIIRGLAKREAHHKLYGTFLKRRHEFDLLIKVDADMVLTRNDFFERVTKHFQDNSHLELLCVSLQDFFTRKKMWGLNVYRNTIQWQESSESVFTDAVSVLPANKTLDDSLYAPAALHSPNPSSFQAFHFGIHRGFKAAEAVRRQMWQPFYSRMSELEATWLHWQESQDRRLALAVIGGEIAIQDELSEEDLPYESLKVQQLFRDYNALDLLELKRLAKIERFRTWGRFPSRIRIEAIRGGWKTFFLRCAVPPKRRRRIVKRTQKILQSLLTKQ